MSSQKKIKKALELINEYGGIEGDHHKAWVLDQLVRILTGYDKGYNIWIKEHNNGIYGKNTYDWDVGIPP